MYHLKTKVEINQLQLHIKNLSTEVSKIIVQNNQVNRKMYPYNFQKTSLKLHKYTTEFMDHLTIQQNLYNTFQEIKTIYRQLAQASRDRKARSSRTFMNDQSLGNLSSSSRFINSALDDQDDNDSEENDLIEQFMIKRNHEIQANLFGDVDEGFKTKERKGLEEFLNHANIHAKNLESQLKNASQQRKKISNSFRLGAMTNNKVLFKKKTFDLQRINQMMGGDFSREMSGSIQNEEPETAEIQVQTIFTGENIKWDKILTYCLNKTDRSSQESEKSQQGSPKDDFLQVFDKEIFGQIQRTTLQSCHVQTQEVEEKSKGKESQRQKNPPKTQPKGQASKGNKRVMQKTANQKTNKTKENQSKTNTIQVKPQQKEDISLAIISTPQNEPQKPNPQAKLKLQSLVWCEWVLADTYKPPTHTTFQHVPSLASKKSMKALQLKEMVFQFTSKKELYKKAGMAEVTRSHKKNRSMVGSSISAQKSEDGARQTQNSINESHRKAASDEQQEEVRTYETSVNIEEGLVRRKLEKKNTWKAQTNSTHSILKSTSKLKELKSQNTIQNGNKSSTKLYNLHGSKDSNCLTEMTESSSFHAKKKLQRRTSNFKQMYGVTSPQSIMNHGDKKQNFNKRNTLDAMIGNSDFFKSQMAPLMMEFHFKNSDEALNNNLIQEEEFEMSYRNTEESLDVALNLQNSKRSVQKSNLPIIETKREQQALDEDWQSNISHKQVHTACMAYKKPEKTKPKGQTLPKNEQKQYLQSQSIHKKKNLRVRTQQKQNQQDLCIRNEKLQRSSATLHQIGDLGQIISKNPNKRKAHHNKHYSQDLPDLSGCKQKLSTIKKTLSKQAFYKTTCTNNDFTATISTPSLLKKQSSVFICQSQQPKPSNCASPLNPPTKLQEQTIIKTLRKLFLTNTYRDKLLLYLSMIEVTHERYCGKNCEHVGKFIKDMTGGVDVAEESVANQLLKLYTKKGQTKLIHGFGGN